MYLFMTHKPIKRTPFTKMSKYIALESAHCHYNWTGLSAFGRVKRHKNRHKKNIYYNLQANSCNINVGLIK